MTFPPLPKTHGFFTPPVFICQAPVQGGQRHSLWLALGALALVTCPASEYQSVTTVPKA